MLSIQERLKARTQQQGECLLWTGPCTRDGYGTASYRNKTTRVHRVAWMLVHGTIPDGLGVLHTCDTPKCVRIEHLFLGSPQDNSTDMVNKGRQARGDRSSSRLYPERLARGDRHGSKRHPERLPRGERHGRRLHPERFACGSASVNAKLTEEDVVCIRESYVHKLSTLRALASKYGVSANTVHRIVKYRVWKHISTPTISTS